MSLQDNEEWHVTPLPLLKHKSFVRILIASCLAALSGLLCFLSLSYGHDWGGDFSEYIAQAISLSEKTVEEQIQANTYIVDNSDPGFATPVYSWGLPILLVPIYRAFGLNIYAFKFVGLVSFACFIFTLFLFYSNQFNNISSIILILCFSLNSLFTNYCNQILSELPYLFFCTASIFCLYKLSADAISHKKYAYGFLSGIFIFCAYLCRSIGIVIILTWFCYQVLSLISYKRNWRIIQKINYSPALLLPYIILTVGIFVSSRILPAGDSYMSLLKDISLHSVAANLSYALFCLNLLFPTLNTSLTAFIYLLCVIFFCIGVCSEYRRNWIALFYILGNIAVIAFFPYTSTQGLRYFIPIYPFVALFIFHGIRALCRKIQAPNKAKLHIIRTFLPIALPLLIMLSISPIFLSNIASNLSNDRYNSTGAYSKDAVDLYDYIRENTDKNSVIMFRKPRVLWLNTHRKGFTKDILAADPSDRILHNADYYLYSTELSDEEELSAIQNNDQTYSIETAYMNDSFVLYKILH